MSSAARASRRLLAPRSVHLRIQPRPANLSESREIYRVLQSFGEVSTYKSLRYEYHNPAANTALAIFRDADAAQKAIDASPLRFALERVVEDDEGMANVGSGNRNGRDADAMDDDTTAREPINTSISEMTRPSPFLTASPTSPPIPSSTITASSPTSPQPKTKPVPMPFDPSPPKPTTAKWFQVTVDRSRVVHQDYTERQPYWKQFSPMKSLGQQDLEKSVPLAGLSDVSKRPLYAHRTPVRVLGIMSEYVEKRMVGVRRLSEEAAEARGVREER